MKNLIIAVIFCCTFLFPTIINGNTFDAEIDGNLSESELKNTQVSDLAGDGKVFYKTDGSNLYIGVRGIKAGISHVCITDGKNIYVLHSSGALGKAVFQQKNGMWQLTEKFNWELRDKAMTPEVQKARKDYFEQNGWLANVVGMGNLTEMEYIISDKFLDGEYYRFNVVYAVDPNSIQYFPANLTDDSNFVKLISGDPPEILKFDTNSWAVLNKALTNSKEASSLSKVPNGNNILVNGFFHQGEWEKAFRIKIDSEIEMLSKQDENYVYMGFRFLQEKHTGLDLYLKSGKSEGRMLHISAALGEKSFQNGKWQEMIWGQNNHWTGNVLNLVVEDGKRRIIEPDGFEFQINKKMLKSKKWYLRLHLKRPDKIIPQASTSENEKDWIQIIL